MPLVSVIVACRNESQYIELFLESVLGQTESCEIVIADGMSQDDTRSKIQIKIQTTRQNYAGTIQLIDNPRGITSSGLNLALAASAGDIIVRMDAHTTYSSDYVAMCLAVLDETGATNVGGPALTRATGFWQGATALGFHSPFFSGGARFHNPSYEGPVDTVPYGCWRRCDLEALGGFDEELVRNQDDELNFRIQRTGGLVWQSPRIRSWYSPRHSLPALARQYYEYGFWKLAVIRKHGRPARWRHVIPAIAGCALLVLTLTSFVSPLSGVALISLVCLYALSSLVASLACAARSRKFAYLPALPFVFATVHAAYASGLLMSIFRDATRR